MIVCVHIPRFELAVAAAERAPLGDQALASHALAGQALAGQALAGRALAVAPLAGADRSQIGQRVGEVSGAAEARGVARGMALGEALARCPDLVLLPGDPVRVAEVWEATMRALEAIGAAVEPAGPGTACFEPDGLLGIHGTRQATLAAARRAIRRGGRLPVRIGAGPTRFCALAAAVAVRSSRPLVLEKADAQRWLAGQPIGLLGLREDTAALVEPLSRLGVRTLGELARLGRPALADRFGARGTLAHQLACAEDRPLRTRRVEERLEESMNVGDASSGEALKRVLGVLVSRLLARPERRGRTLRVATLSARLVSGGGWRERVVFRQALADPERIWLALSVRLLSLPAPALALALAVERFGPPASEQGALFEELPAAPGVLASGARPHPTARARSAARAARLREAVAQMRAVAGQDAALRAVCVDPDSRVPERRVVLAPVPER